MKNSDILAGRRTCDPYTSAFPNQGHVSEALSKREYFAAKAMAGLLSDGSKHFSGPYSGLAEAAVTYADHLITELNR